MDSRDWNEVFGEEVHFLFRNGGSGWIHGIETRFLFKEVHFLSINGGLRWIHGVGTRFLVT